MRRKITSTIAGAAVFMAVAAIISRSLGFLREVIYANIFGLNKDFDIYLVSAVFPIIINTSVFFIIQNYFIPAYHKIPLSKHSERMDLFSRSFIISICAGLSLAFFLFLFKGFLLGNYLWSTDQHSREVAERIYELFILTIPFSTGYSIISSYLQAESDFLHPSLAQLLLNLPIIIVVITLNNLWGIYTIGVGFLTGNIIQFFYLYLVIRKNLSVKNFSLFKKESFKFKLSTGFLVIVAIEVVNQLPLFIDRYFYNYLPTGGVASLNYASVLFQLPMSVFSFALSTAIFPKLSEFFHKSDLPGLEYFFNSSIRIIVIIFIPISFVMYNEGGNIIRLLFQHGEFKDYNTIATYKVLQMYSYSLIFYAVYSIINKMIYSAGLEKHLLVISIILILLKLILNFTFLSNLQQYGLALSSSVIYILICLCSMWLIYLKVPLANKTFFIRHFIIFIIISILSYYLSVHLVGLINMDWFIVSGLRILIFGGIYLLSIYTLKIKFF